MSKKLIINADDYGLCPEVNAAIEDLITDGQLQNVSVLTNSEFYEEALDFLLDHRQCSVGVHLNVVEGIPLSSSRKVSSLINRNGHFANLAGILKRWFYSPSAVSKEIETEWRAQIEFLRESGLEISHADSHQHIHAFPPFWKIFIKLCREYEISAARLPRERNKIRLRRAPAFALRQSANLSEMFFSNGDLITSNHFLGFKRAGAYGKNEMIGDIQNLGNGVTELIIHPSMRDGVPYASMRGMLEYEALSSPEVWDQIAESKVEVTSWAKLAKPENAIIY